MSKKDKKPDKQEEDDLGFEPITDEELGFEPDLSSEEQAAVADYVSQPEGPSMGESALLGAEQGLTLNHAPQLGAAFGAGLEKLAGTEMGPEGFPLVPGVESSKDKKLKDLYNEYLKYNKQRDAQAAQANPWSYGAGGIGGGLLGFKGASMAAKPAMAAVAQRAPTLAATGQVMNKIYPGAIPMGIASGIMAEGSSEHPITSPQGMEDIAHGVGMGMTLGTVAPPVISKTAQVAQKAAQGIKGMGNIIGESVFGMTPDAYRRGLEGEMLVGKKAAQQTGDEMMQFSQEVPQMLEAEVNKLGAQKQAIIRIAQDNGVRIDPADIDEFINNHLKGGSASNLTEVQREIGQIHELLKTAKSGPEVQKITRRYFGMGNTEKGEFAQLFSQKQAEQEALAAQEPPPPLSQKQQFEHEFAARKAEQQAIAGGQDPNPLELTYEPIPETKNVLGIMRQPQFDADGHFIGYKKIKTQVITPDAPPIPKPKLEMLLQPTDVPGKSLGIIRQAIVDAEGNVTGYKKLASKLLSEEESAMWKDMSEKVRAGGKDLTEPEQLYQLYKDLKAKSEFGDFSLRTPDAKALTGQAIEDVQALLRKYMNELEPTDNKIAALKRAQEILGSTDRDPRNVMKTFAALLGKTEGTNLPGAAARHDLSNLINQIKVANPALGHLIESKAQDLANKFAVTGAVQKEIYLPRPTATLKAYAAKGANVLGYSIGQVTPEWMLNTAGKLIRGGGKAQQMLSNVLKKAAEKDDQTRTAIMFGLMQQPAYRKMLEEHMPQAQPNPNEKPQ